MNRRDFIGTAAAGAAAVLPIIEASGVENPENPDGLPVVKFDKGLTTIANLSEILKGKPSKKIVGREYTDIARAIIAQGWLG